MHKWNSRDPDRWELDVERRMTKSEFRLDDHDRMHEETRQAHKEICVWQRVVVVVLLVIILAVANGNVDAIAQLAAHFIKLLI